MAKTIDEFFHIKTCRPHRPFPVVVLVFERRLVVVPLRRTPNRDDRRSAGMLDKILQRAVRTKIDPNTGGDTNKRIQDTAQFVRTKHLMSHGKETVVIISADASAKHQSVVTVMEAARRAGLNQITFATQSSAQSGR